MKTRITELFGIEHPVLHDGLPHVGFAENAAAVGNAGGLGMIVALSQQTPKDLVVEMARCRNMTEMPFGINLAFISSYLESHYEKFVEVIRSLGVGVVETTGPSLELYIDSFKAAEIKVIHKCDSISQALMAEKVGCDAVIIDGFSCRDDPKDDVSNSQILPSITEELDVPFIASGGGANAEYLAEALSFGADGINIVPEFEIDGHLEMNPLLNIERKIIRDAVEKAADIERRKGNLTNVKDVLSYVEQLYSKVKAENAWCSGSDSISEPLDYKDIINEIVVGAENILSPKLFM